MGLEEEQLHENRQEYADDDRHSLFEVGFESLDVGLDVGDFSLEGGDVGLDNGDFRLEGGFDGREIRFRRQLVNVGVA